MLFSRVALASFGLAALAEGLSIREEALLLRRQNRNGGGNFGGGSGNFGGNNAANSEGNNGASAAAAAASTAANNRGNAGGNNNAAAADKGSAATATCLNANAIQTGSLSDGQNPPVDGQAASATDAANFVNFCSGQTLTNGIQVKGGSLMGKIPSTSNMVSSIIVSPAPAEHIAANKDFTVSVQTSGLTAGSFTNAAATYYSAPQDLSGSGQIIGHTHITVQDMGNSLAPTAALDPNTFVFFKGVNDAGNGKGLLSATVTGGLPAGNYRVCTMSSSSNHQPVLMPVAQRGAQDDCQKFTVGGNSAASANSANSGNAGAGSGAAGKATTTTKAAATGKSRNGGRASY